MLSRLVRALWIEIPPFEGGLGGGTCRGSWEPCGLKSELFLFCWVWKDVEARESLVDWNCQKNKISSWFQRRGSWEPCGLKWWWTVINSWDTKRRGSWEPCGLKFLELELVEMLQGVEARESLVDWNIQLEDILNFLPCRGSWEPCGLKFLVRYRFTCVS